MRGEVVEDIAPGRALPRPRACRCACLAGGDAVAFRMYPGGLRQLVEGWTKNIAARRRRGRPVAGAGARRRVGGRARLAVDGRPPSRARRGRSAAPTCRVVALAAYARGRRSAAPDAAARRVVPVVDVRVLFPVPLAAFVGVFVRSAWSPCVRPTGAAGGAAACRGRRRSRARRAVSLPRATLGPTRRPCVVDIAAWALIHAAHGLRRRTACPLRWLEHDTWLLAAAALGARRAALRARSRIRRWKDRLPEAGALFAGGCRSGAAVGRRRRARALRRRDPAGRAGPLAGDAAGGPLFVLWNPPRVAAVMVVYGVAVNAAVHRHPALQPAARRPRWPRAAVARRRQDRRRPRRRSRSARGTTGSSIP